MVLKIKEERLSHIWAEYKYLTFQTYLQYMCIRNALLETQLLLSVIPAQTWRNSIGFKERYHSK